MLLDRLDRNIAPQIFPVRPIHLPTYYVKWLDAHLACHVLEEAHNPLLQIMISWEITDFPVEARPVLSCLAKAWNKGTKKYSAEEIEKLIAGAGGTLSLQLHKDHLVMEIIVIKVYWTKLVSLIGEIVHRPTFPVEALEPIKKEILHTIKDKESNHSTYAQSTFFRTCFEKDHHYGYTIKEEEVSKLAREDLQIAYQQLQKSKLYLSMSGGVTSCDLKSLHKIFPHNPSAKNELHKLKSIPLSYNPQQIHQKRKYNQQACLVIGKPLTKLDVQICNQFTVANCILGGYFGSRLMQVLREKKGYSYGIHSELINFQHYDLWCIRADLLQTKWEVSLQIIQDEISKLQKTAIDESELEDVKQYLLGAFLASFETIFDWHHHLHYLLLEGKDLATYLTFQRDLSTICTYNIQKIAQDYLQWDELTNVIIT